MSGLLCRIRCTDAKFCAASVALARPTEFISHQFNGFDQPALLTLALIPLEKFRGIIVRWHDDVAVFTVLHQTNSLPWSSMRPIVMR
jgi:hypothetical protein